MMRSPEEVEGALAAFETIMEKYELTTTMATAQYHGVVEAFKWILRKPTPLDLEIERLGKIISKEAN